MLLPIATGISTRQGQRSSNQDRAAACLPWAFVLDGVGGSKNGGAAAQIALGALMEESALLPNRFGDSLTQQEAGRALVESAHARVSRLLGTPDGRTSGSTTLTLAHLQIRDPRFVDVMIASVGDSPVWVTSAGSIPVLVSSTRLGVRKNELDEAIGWLHHEPRLYFVSPPVPGRLVLATDGILAVHANQRNQLMSDKKLTAQECASRLTAAAMEEGGRDNTTVLVLDFGEPSMLASDHLQAPRLLY